MERINCLSWWLMSERRTRRNALKLRAVRIFGLVTLVSLLVALGTAAMGGEPSLLDLAATEGELSKPGEFQDDVLEWDRKHITVYWKGESYQPLRCRDENGATLYHLWLDGEGKVVTDEKLIEELFTALCLLPALTPSQLNLEAGKALDRADNHKEEAELYESIAWDASLVQTASTFFSIVMSLPTTDPAGYWDLLSGSISVYNSLNLFSNIMSLYGDSGDVTEEDVRKILAEHRSSLAEEVLGIHYSRLSALKSVSDVASQIKKQHDLSRVLIAETDFFSRFTLEADLSTARLDLKKAMSSLPWALFTYAEDTETVAKEAAEFTLMNRTACLSYQKLADIYGRAAEGKLQDADEVKLLSVWVPITTQLRGVLLERYLKAYQGRKKTISGVLWWAYEKVAGEDVEVEAEDAIAMNRDLLVMEQESFRRALISLEVETNASLTALRRLETMGMSAEDEQVSTQHLGTITYQEAPETWTITVPEDFSKVEVSIYGYGREDEGNMYGGWNAWLEVNGNRAWKFMRYDSKLGGIIQDYLKEEEVFETSGKDSYYDITSMVTPGENTITYSHYTEGSGIGVKVKIHRKT